MKISTDYHDKNTCSLCKSSCDTIRECRSCIVPVLRMLADMEPRAAKKKEAKE